MNEIETFESQKKKIKSKVLTNDEKEEIEKHNKELLKNSDTIENVEEQIMLGNRSGLARFNHFQENRRGEASKYFRGK